MSDHPKPRQCERPSGWLGKLVIWSMNRRHAAVTDWGLRHATIGTGDSILDVGCGGGKAVEKMARLASAGRVCGIDYSTESVAAARRVNQDAITRGQVEIQCASVSDLPYAEGTFDLATAIETHFWWPDRLRGFRDIRRVLRPGGRVYVIAEFYMGPKYERYRARLERATTMALLTAAQHREMLADAGFDDVRVIEDEARGWICATGTRPRVG